jgi:hypothetical protein
MLIAIRCGRCHAATLMVRLFEPDGEYRTQCPICRLFSERERIISDGSRQEKSKQTCPVLPENPASPGQARELR